MTTKIPKKMVALKVLETSGVDHPAHLEEGWIVMKNATPMEDSMANAEDEVVVDINEQYIDRMVELEAELTKARETIAELKKEVEAIVEPEEEAPVDEEEALMKSLPEPVREMLAKAAADTEAARAELRKEKEVQRDREFVAKAATWSNLSLEADDFGVALRKVADINSDLAATIEKAFDAVNAQQEAAAIFSELGANNRSTSSDAFGKVTSLAKAAVDAGEFKTVEQAISGLVAKNPDLYNQYLSEK